MPANKNKQAHRTALALQTFFALFCVYWDIQISGNVGKIIRGISGCTS